MNQKFDSIRMLYDSNVVFANNSTADRASSSPTVLFDSFESDRNTAEYSRSNSATFGVNIADV
ncbi:hypothetical protein DERP_007197 [Dermatophagoides pteronyssinus]|uniref:Uncharacterized protein n=1 Tax=Dermatophagoides pteronyssinus TaxID=6956 RepID=A0ABQ8JUL0_DERPT|nr:hypothetical protein DERP_007197 [Dermatophagoides pteronyssinus]